MSHEDLEDLIFQAFLLLGLLYQGEELQWEAPTAQSWELAPDHGRRCSHRLHWTLEFQAFMVVPQ